MLVLLNKLGIGICNTARPS